MPLRYRIGHAFRWRPTTQECELSDLIRIDDEADTLMIALANGHECGWTACWSKGSRVLLDLLVEAWRSTSGSIDARIPAVLGEVRAHFPGRARELVGEDPDDLVGPPGGTVLLVTVQGAACRFDWIGADSGLVIRDSAVAIQTTPHTLQEDLRAQGMSEDDVKRLPAVVLHSISEDLAPSFEAGRLALPFSLEDGDCILLVNKGLRQVLASDELARRTSARGSPQELAEELVQLAFERGDLVYAAAVAVRYESSP